MITSTAGTSGLLSPRAEGVTIPAYLGRHYQVQMIPLQEPTADRLAVAIGTATHDALSPGLIVLSTQAEYDKLSTKGLLQIGPELFLYIGKPAALTLGPAQRLPSGGIVEHPAGETVYFRGPYTGLLLPAGGTFDFGLIQPLVYTWAIAWNPGLATHRHRAVPAVYSNGVRLQDLVGVVVRPTITLDDQTVYTDESIVSARLEIAADTSAASPTAYPGSASTPDYVRRIQAPRTGRPTFLWPRVPRAPRWTGPRRLGSRLQALWAPGAALAPRRPRRPGPR